MEIILPKKYNNLLIQSSGWIHGFLHNFDKEKVKIFVQELLGKDTYIYFERDFENSSSHFYGISKTKPKKKLEELLNTSKKYLVWIDQSLVMYSKNKLHPIAYIGLPHYDLNRFYMLTIFYIGDPDTKITMKFTQTESKYKGILVENYNKILGKKAPLGFIDSNNLEIFKVMPGNDYRNKTTYHGAYPRTLLERYEAMYPTKDKKLLHLFSGSLPKSELYIRVDAYVEDTDIKCNAEELSKKIKPKSYDIIYADPPYSLDDLNKYEEINKVSKSTKFLDRKKVLLECSKILKDDGLIFWLDCVSINHLEIKEFKLIGYISIIRSTNHRFRMVSIFQKQNK